MINSYIKNIILISIAIIALLLINGSLRANGCVIQPEFSFSSLNPNKILTGNHYSLSNHRKISTIKVPIIRRKYFREERNLAMTDFCGSFRNRIFTSLAHRLHFIAHFQQSFISLSLLRAPPEL